MSREVEMAGNSARQGAVRKSKKKQTKDEETGS